MTSSRPPHLFGRHFFLDHSFSRHIFRISRTTSKMVFLTPDADTLKLLRDSLPDSYVDKVGNPSDPVSTDDTTKAIYGEDDEVLAYVASLAAALSKSNDFAPDTWTGALGPYLSTLPSLDGDAEDLIEKFREAAEKAVMGEEDDTEDEEDGFGGEELTNIRVRIVSRYFPD